MSRPNQPPSWIFVPGLRAGIAVFALSLTLLLTFVTPQPAQAQTFQVLYRFSGSDGAYPRAGLTMDQKGNFYGTASGGGNPTGFGDGTVFQFSRSANGWKLSTLYTFLGGNDGEFPDSEVVFGPDGALYGTTFYGGNHRCTNGGGGPYGCGTAYRLAPLSPTAPNASWQETVLYRFGTLWKYTDGYYPGTGNLAFDQAGNLYGTTTGGGEYGPGVLYELTPESWGGTESVLWNFSARESGPWCFFPGPYGGVVFGTDGNLYGTTLCPGGVFQYDMANGRERTVYNLDGFSSKNDANGDLIYAGLIFDQAGNLYGAASSGGAAGGGTVFELTPSGSDWSFQVLHPLQAWNSNNGLDRRHLCGYYPECGPVANLVMDAAGNLYGTTDGNGAYGCGSVFRLTPSDGGWTYTSLHDFNCGSDGAGPMGSLLLEGNGNIYGTAVSGGCEDLECRGGGYGVIYEITP